jgi:hypothetical protein
MSSRLLHATEVYRKRLILHDSCNANNLNHVCRRSPFSPTEDKPFADSIRPSISLIKIKIYGFNITKSKAAQEVLVMVTNFPLLRRKTGLLNQYVGCLWDCLS